MASTTILRKGFDIKLRGEANKFVADAPEPEFYALKSADFPGLIARINVKPGDKVLAGSPLFQDKVRPEILYTSPVSGAVKEIKRIGPDASTEVIVERTGDEFMGFGITNPANATREHIKKILLISGLWPSIRQRPFHIVANPDDVPKSVFVSGFDTAPLAPDYNFIINNSSASFLKTGFNVLKKLTDGKVNLILESRSNNAEAYISIPDLEISYFSGPHPAGNTGVHIYHLDRISKGQVVWFANLQDVLAIGRLFEEGRYDHRKIIALTGSGVLHQQYYKVRTGGSVSNMLRNNVKGGNLVCLSGNILTGTRIGTGGFTGFYDSQVTVVTDEEYFQLFGKNKSERGRFGNYKALVSKLFPRRQGKRAIVLPGKNEKVLPMDVYPLQLIRAILEEDIGSMEKLGIYDVAEEDMALCEFSCPSGTDVRSLIRHGIDLVISSDQGRTVRKNGHSAEKTSLTV